MSRWNLVFALSTGIALAACGQQKSAEKSPEPAVAPDQGAQATGEASRPGSSVQPGTQAAAPQPYTDPVPETQAQGGTVVAERAPTANTRTSTQRQATASRNRTTRSQSGRAEATRRQDYPAPRDSRPEPVERVGREREGDDSFGRERSADVEERGRLEARAAERMTIPAGTELTLVLETPVSSTSSHEGDAVTARVERAVGEDGRITLPGGTVLHGRVVQVDEGGRVSGRAHVGVDFDQITVRGQKHRLDTTTISATAPQSRGRDAKIIGGGTAAGIVIGGILGGKSGAAKGALIGAGAGGAAVLVNKGQDVELPAGSRWVVRVRNTVRM